MTSIRLQPAQTEGAETRRSARPVQRGAETSLTFQVVLHAQIASDRDAFSFDDVATAIADKMERRHPHIFGGAPTRPDWEALKASERTDASALAGVALALPALMRAQKLQARAARVGFDWPDASGPRAKIDEELAEVAAASDDDARENELGDVLFSVVNFARHLGIDAESALRRANDKFSRRFTAMQAMVPSITKLDLAAMEALWNDAKRR